MTRLLGRTAFITGGARGQGQVLAWRLAADGADIVICDVGEPESLAETVAGVEKAGRRCVAGIADVRSQAEVDAIVARGIETLGAIDILVANAGITGPLRRFWEVEEADWQRTFDINMTGVWHAAKAVAPHMIERLSGTMVFTSSMNGIEGGINVGAYASTKHGVLGLMKCVALELAPFGIRVNAVLPGPIDTGMLDNAVVRDHIGGRTGTSREDYLLAMRPFFALRGRTSLPAAAVADAVAWLVSDDAQHIAGVELPVDAGHGVLPGVNQSPAGFDDGD